MGKYFQMALSAGTTAAVIFLSISLMTQMDRGQIGLWALVLLVVVTVVSTVVSTVVAGRATARR